MENPGHQGIASRFKAKSVGASLGRGGWGWGDRFTQGCDQWLDVKDGNLRSRLSGRWIPMLRGSPLSMLGCGVLNASPEEEEGMLALLLGWLPRELACSNCLPMISCTGCPRPCLPSGQTLPQTDHWASTLKGSTDRWAQSPMWWASPKACWRVFEILYASVQKCPRPLGFTAVTAIGSAVNAGTTASVMPALFSHHGRTVPCSGPGAPSSYLLGAVQVAYYPFY